MSDKIADSKNPKVFRQVKDSPEIPKHRRKWNKKLCKRNEGRSHAIEMTKEIRREDKIYRVRRITDTTYIQEFRKSFWIDREWSCSKCGKDFTFELSPSFADRRDVLKKNAYGLWEESHRFEVRPKRDTRPPFRQSHGYRKTRSD